MKHQTLGNRIKTMEKILEYLLRDKLYADYLKLLEARSDGRTRYFATPEEWDKYFTEHRGYILD